MIRSLLLLLISCAFSYGQDTVAVIQPKFGAGDTEVTLLGDTMLVRLMFDKQKTARQGSEAAWYSSSGKLADADLTLLGKSPIIGISRHANGLYYYVGKQEKKKNEVAVFTSQDLVSLTPSTATPILGVAIRGFARGKNFLVITWEQKNQLVHFYEFDKEHIVDQKQLQLSVDLEKTSASEIAFPITGEPGRISVMSTTLRFFLHGDTFAAVWDMPGTIFSNADVTKFKTGIARLDLSSGKETTQYIFTDKKYDFKSYLLNDHLLYRLVIEKDLAWINIHDLDQENTITAAHPVVIPEKEKVATFRYGTMHQITRSRMRDITGTREKNNIDIGIIVDEYNQEQIISLGFIINVKGGAAVGPPSLVTLAFSLAVTALMQMKDDPNNLEYVYLRGTPETGYKLVRDKEASDFLKIRIDNFEFAAQEKGEIDYWSHFTNNKSWFSLYSYKGDPRFYILKFQKNSGPSN